MNDWLNTQSRYKKNNKKEIYYFFNGVFNRKIIK